MKSVMIIGAADEATMLAEFAKVVDTGRAATAVGINLNAGHDLTRENLPRLVAALPNLKEVSSSHAITADSMLFGMEKTVQLFREAIGN